MKEEIIANIRCSAASAYFSQSGELITQIILRFAFIVSLSGRRRRGDDGLCRVSDQHQEPVSKETAEDETGMTHAHTDAHQ